MGLSAWTRFPLRFSTLGRKAHRKSRGDGGVADLMSWGCRLTIVTAPSPLVLVQIAAFYPYQPLLQAQDQLLILCGSAITSPQHSRLDF